MVIFISTDLFQYKTSMLFQDMGQVFFKMSELVIIKNDTYENNMNILDYVLN